MSSIAHRLTALFVAAGLAVPGPVLADDAFYYRRGGALPGYAAPPVTNDFVEGTGEMRVMGPVDVRARPGVYFSLQLDAVDPSGGVTWQAPDGLPAGLSMSAAGLISGYPTQVARRTGIAATATDATGRKGTTRPFAIDVRPLPSVTMHAIGTLAAGGALAARPAASDVYGSQTWRLASGTLPVGVSLDVLTGALDGSPEQRGTFPGLTLAVSDADGAVGVSNPFTITIDSNLAISGLLTAYQGRTGRPLARVRPYVVGGSGSYTWSLATGSGPLPPGLTLDPYGNGIGGTPASTGTWPAISIRARDPSSGDVVASPPFSMTIASDPTLATGGSYVGRSGTQISITPKVTGLLGGGAWFVRGEVPSGLSFNDGVPSLYGTLGTPGTTQGTSFRVVDLFDGAEATSAPFATTILPRLGISVPRYPVPRVGDAIVVPPPVVTGLQGAGTVRVTGAAPDGMLLDPATGGMSGTPTKTGGYPLSYSVTDSLDGATSDTGTFVLSVAPRDTPVALAAITPAATLRGQVGRRFSTSLIPQGNKGGVSWTLSGPVPGWLGLDPATGALTGTPDAAAASGGLTATLTDVDGARATSEPFSISVAPADLPSISMGNVTATAGTAFTSSRPSVANQTAPAAFALAFGTLPPGLSVVPATGALSGTPTDAGTYGDLVLRMTDGSGAIATSAPFSIVVQPALGTANPPTASLPSTLSGSISVAFSALPYTGGLAGAQSWTVASGTKPSWAAIDPSTGRISGTPDAVGSSAPIVLAVTDASGKRARTNAFTISVSAAPALVASIQERIVAPVGRPLDVSPQVSGAVGAQAWTLTGTLPDGLSMLPSTGRIQGTPTRASEATGLSLSVTDAGGARSSTQPFAISVPAQALVASLARQSYGTHGGMAFSTSPPTVSNNVGTVSWSAAPALPAGVTLDMTTGILSGTVSAAGTYGPFVLTAHDVDGKAADTQGMSISVVGDPSVSTATGYQARQGFAFSMTPRAANVIGSTAWTLASGDLPTWARLDASTGTISGTPSVLAAATSVSLRVSDGTGASATSAPFSISVGTNLTAVADASSYRARVGSAFATGAPTANGASGAVRWSLAPGVALPSWMHLEPTTGALSGTPDVAGTWTLSLKATDAGGGTATTASFQVVSAPTVTVTAASASGRVNAPLSVSPVAQGAYGATRWTLASGTLPTGLSVDPSTGIVSGRPTAAGTQSGLALAVTDADGASAGSGPFSITVTEGISVSGVPATIGGRAGDPMEGPVPSVGNARGAVSWDARILPAGVLARADGSIAGTPTQPGAYPVTVTATDASDGAQAAARTTVSVAPTLQITESIPSVTVHAGDGFATAAPRFVGQRGTSLEWSSAGAALPPGASVSGGTGIVMAPSTVTTATTYPGLVVMARDPVDGRTALSAPFSVNLLGAPYVTDVPTSYTARYDADLRTSAPRAVDAIGAVTWQWAAGTTPPSWAKVDPATGSITGRVAAFANTPGLALAATDSTGKVARSVTFSLNVYSQPGVALSDVSSLRKLRVGDSYTLTPTASGVAGTQSWSLVADGSGTLPAGLSVDAAGKVGGTVTAPGTVTFALAVRDSSDGAVATSQKVTLDARPALGLSGLQANYTVRSGAFVTTDTPVVTGLQGSLGYALTNLTLPANGLSFDATQGVIKGLTNGALAKRAVTLTATDGWDARKATASFDFGALGPFAVGTPSSVAGRNDTDIALSAFTPATATNNVGAVTWSKGSGPWPTWLTVDPSTGKLVGTPSGYPSTTTVSNLTVKGTDSDGGTASSGAFSVTVNAAMTTSISQTTYKARSGRAFSTSAPNPPVGRIGTVTWSVVTRSGTQPASLAVASNGQVTFTASAAEVGTWAYALRATDSAGGATADTQDVTATIAGALAVTAPAPTNVRLTGKATSAPPAVANLLGTASWTVTQAGRVCTTNNYGYCSTGGQGYSFDGNTGAMTVSTDNTTGSSFSFTVSMTDSGDGSTATTTIPFTVTARPTLAAAPDVKARWGVPYTSTAIALNAPKGTVSASTWFAVDYPANVDYQYYYACANSYPTGVSVGQVVTVNSTADSGYKTYSACVKAVDTGDNAYLIYTQGIAVADQVGVTGAPAANVTLTKGTAYSWTLTATGTVSNPTWTPTGALPAGISLSGTGATVRTLSGTPTQVGTFAYSLAVADPWDGSTKTVPVNVTVVDSIGAATLADATTRVTSDFNGAAPALSAGTAPFAWTLQSGTLPPGTTVDATTGSVKGRPTTAGTYSAIKLRATDANGAVADTNAFKVTVAANPLVMARNPATLTFHTGVAASYPTTVTGNLGAVTWSTKSYSGTGTTWPAWMMLGADGTISGTPPSAGSGSGYSIYATDADGSYVSTSIGYSAIPQMTANLNTMPSTFQAHASTAASVTGVPSTSNKIGTPTWDLVTVSGSSPAGLAVVPSTGAVSFSSGAVGTWGYQLRATDPFDGSTALTPVVTVTFVDQFSSTYSPSTVNVRQTAALSYQNLKPTNSNAIGTVSYAWKSGQPSSWTLNASTGAIAGGNQQVLGTTTAVITATDGGGAKSDASIVVNSTPGVTVTYPTTLKWRVNKAVNATFVGGNVVGTPTYAVYVSGFPAGLTLSSDGKLTGTPTTAVASQSTGVYLKDAYDEAYATAQASVTVVGALAYTTQPTSVSVVTGSPATSTKPAVGNAIGATSYALMNGSTDITSNVGTSCPGITFAASTGQLSGTPTSPCSLPGLTLVATDATDAATATSTPFSLTVTAAASPGHRFWRMTKINTWDDFKQGAWSLRDITLLTGSGTKIAPITGTQTIPYPGFTASNFFDSSLTSLGAGKIGDVLTMDLASAQSPVTMSIHTRENDSYGYYVQTPLTFDWEWSDDNLNWTRAGTVNTKTLTGETAIKGATTYTFPLPTP